MAFMLKQEPSPVFSIDDLHEYTLQAERSGALNERLAAVVGYVFLIAEIPPKCCSG